MHPQAEGPWSVDFCGCCSDLTTCCMTVWCPCITFGRIAEIVDRGSTSCATSGALYLLMMHITGCLGAGIYSCSYRTKLRKQYNIKGGSCGDCMKHFFCGLCALTQEYRELQNRELQNRGFDMSLGWHGNAERQNRGITMAPHFEKGMTK